MELIISRLKLNFNKIFDLLSKKGFFHLLSANFLTQFLGFGTILLVTKFVSPTELGQIKIIQSYIGIFVIIAGFGLNTAILKYCAEKFTNEERKGILKYSIKKSIITTAISYLLLIILVFTGIIKFPNEIVLWVIVYGLVIPILVATNIGMTYLQALKQIKKMAKVQSILKIQSCIIIVISTYFWGFKGFICSTILAYIVGLFPLYKLIGKSFLSADILKPQGFLTMAIFSALANVMSLVGQYGDIFILDRFSGAKDEIGFYSLATIFLIGASQVTGTVQSIVTPYFSEYCRDEKWITQQLMKNQLRMIGLSSIVAIGIYFFCYYFIPLIYGERYLITLLYLKILLIKYVIYSSYAIIGVALVGLGLTKYNLISDLITTPISLFLSYLFLNWYGIIGVAYAQVVVAGIYLILVLIISRIALRQYFSRQSLN